MPCRIAWRWTALREWRRPMDDLCEIRAIVRLELLERTVHRLKEAGVPRMSVQRVHAMGAGVDPATARISVDEGTELAVKAGDNLISLTRLRPRFTFFLPPAKPVSASRKYCATPTMADSTWGSHVSTTRAITPS